MPTHSVGAFIVCQARKRNKLCKKIDHVYISAISSLWARFTVNRGIGYQHTNPRTPTGIYTSSRDGTLVCGQNSRASEQQAGTITCTEVSEFVSTYSFVLTSEGPDWRICDLNGGWDLS